MITKIYQKNCNIELLREELLTAGFIGHGLRCDGKTTTVLLPDSEKKDPKAIVETHIYTAPKTVEELQTAAKSERDAKIDACTTLDELKAFLKE